MQKNKRVKMTNREAFDILKAICKLLDEMGVE